MQSARNVAEPLHGNDDGAVIFDGKIEECRDHAGPFKWCSASLSRDGEFICGGAVVKGRHILHLWQARGSHIAAVLEGPQTGVVACGWHPDSSRCVFSDHPPSIFQLIQENRQFQCHSKGMRNHAWYAD